MKPLVSVIIVNFNGKQYLKECLDSVYNQSYKNIEIIFVDNGSKDDSVIWVEKNYSKTKIVRNEKNLGFAEGNNIGYKNSSGDYIFLMNNDAWLDDRCLEELVAFMEKDRRVGVAQAKAIQARDKDKLDMCGGYLTNTTFLYHLGYGKSPSLPIYNISRKVHHALGACMMVRRAVIKSIGFFNADFWCYWEDIDFCHRAWLSGWECWYYPKAVCYHYGHGTGKSFSDSFVQFHSFKNNLMLFIRDTEIKTIIQMLPIRFFVGTTLSLYWFITRRYSLSWSFPRSLVWVARNIRKILWERKIVQKTRKISDKEIFAQVMKNPRLFYYVCLFRGLSHLSPEFPD